MHTVRAQCHAVRSALCSDRRALACRYEVNPELVDDLESAGLRFVGKDDTGQRMEIVELDTDAHPFFVGVQYHPEFKSRPLAASPVFVGLIAASIGKLDVAYKGVGQFTNTPKKKALRL